MVKVETIDSVAEIEKEQPLEALWQEKTVYQRLLTTQQAYPDRSAVSYQLKSGPKDKAITLTWSDLLARVNQAANCFRALGIKEGDVIAYLLPTTHETLITMLAGMTAGIVAPINPTLEPEKIASLLNDLGAKVLVTLKPFPKTEVAQLAHEACAMAPCVETIIEIDLLEHLSGPLKFIVPLIRPKVDIKHQAQLLDFNEALNNHNADSLDFEEVLDDHYCACFHTGGTTGMPKIAQHRPSGMLYNGWQGYRMLFLPEDVVICPLPLFHVFAAYPVWMGCMFTGAHVVFPTPAGYRGDGVFDNFWKLVERWQATFVVTVPTAAAQLMQREVNADISTLKSAFCGSAPLPVELFKRFQNVTGVKILEGYGMTEATCLISVNPVDGEHRIGSVGFRFPFTEVRILECDEQGKITRECDVGEVGEICVYNMGVNLGETYTDVSKNVGLYADGQFLRTGDLGRMDSEGYLWITGRAKDLIIRGGHNIDPAIIEEELVKHPAVSLVGAIGQPDAKSGEVPCAYIEVVANANVTIDELIAFAQEHVPEGAAVPKYIEILDEIPKTAVGKIFKPDLRRMAITRIYNQSLEEAGINVRVAKVIEDKKRGLVAQLEATGTVNEDEVRTVLGDFIRPWEFV